jgi:hypothetical protein
MQEVHMQGCWRGFRKHSSLQVSCMADKLSSCTPPSPAFLGVSVGGCTTALKQARLW